MSRHVFILLLWMATIVQGIVPAPVIAQDSQAAFPDAVCLNTFEAFAYADREKSRPGPFAYPTPAWTLYTSVPIERIPNLPALEASQRRVYATVVASRHYNNQHELWVVGTVTAPNFFIQSFLAIYQPEVNTWNFIPEVNSDPNLLTQQFFVTPDGTVWVSHQWSNSALPAMASVPVLSRFNDDTGQFELVQTAPQVPVADRSLDPALSVPLKTIMDEQGIFWVFNIDSAVYRFDPVVGVSERKVDLITVAPRGVQDAAVAQDGTIYLSAYNLYELLDDTVFQYQPQTNEIIPVPLPQERWPDYLTLYVDSRNWLWLGTVGYRDDAGEWHLLHTAVDEYFNGPFEAVVAADITTETSDGRLWAAPTYGGIGWLNPVTGTGCSILRDSRLVFEDIEGYVWVGYGTQGELYRYDATP